MSDEILTAASPKAIEKLIEEWSAFTPASRTLDGLTPEQAVTKLEGWPYSIAEQVAHMLFWQRHNFAVIETGVEPKVPTATVGWPVVTKDDWPRLKDEFLAGLQKSREMARDPETLGRIAIRNLTVGLRLVWFTSHDAYHLGQIALMRRLIGAWPPPGGGDTW